MVIKILYTIDFTFSLSQLDREKRKYKKIEIDDTLYGRGRLVPSTMARTHHHQQQQQQQQQ